MKHYSLVCTNCSDYAVNIGEIVNPSIMQSIRLGFNTFHGIQFTHCPWCGAKLIKSPMPIELITAEEAAKEMGVPVEVVEKIAETGEFEVKETGVIELEEPGV